MTEYEEVNFKDEDYMNEPATKRALFIYDVVSVLIGAVVAVLVIICLFFRVSSVVGHSMEPTLYENDRLIITPIKNSYSYGDIVIIHRENDVSLVKRIIATPGDTLDIDFETGDVTVNGEVLAEEYIAEPTYLRYEDGPKFPIKIPEGYYFAMGDNRNNSLDSRSGSIGLINGQYILGKMLIDLNNKEAK